MGQVAQLHFHPDLPHLLEVNKKMYIPFILLNNVRINYNQHTHTFYHHRIRSTLITIDFKHVIILKKKVFNKLNDY